MSTATVQRRKSKDPDIHYMHLIDEINTQLSRVGLDEEEAAKLFGRHAVRGRLSEQGAKEMLRELVGQGDGVA